MNHPNPPSLSFSAALASIRELLAWDWFCLSCDKRFKEDQLVMDVDGHYRCSCGGRVYRYFE